MRIQYIKYLKIVIFKSSSINDMSRCVPKMPTGNQRIDNRPRSQGLTSANGNQPLVVCNKLIREFALCASIHLVKMVAHALFLVCM